MRYLNFVRKNWFLVLIIVFILVGFFWWKTNKKTEAVKTKKGVYTVKRGDLKEDLVLSGEIKANEDVVLRFKTSGRLNWVGVKEGDYVKKYQTIASLDKRELKRNLQKKLNTFVKGRYNFDQTKDDYKDKAIDDEIKRVLEKSQLDLNNDIIDVQLEDIALKYAYLTSPIEGIVIKVGSPYAGVNITPAQAEFEVVNPKTLYLSVSADQTDVVNLKNGEMGQITFDAYPKKTIKGKIDYISFSPKAGETGAVYEVRVNFLKATDDSIMNTYRLGMTGDFKITLKGKKDVLSVPLAYVKKERGKKVVYILENNKRVKRVVKTGVEINGNVEIINGLREKDKVVY